MKERSISKQSTDNCLSLIRIISAIQVMFGHTVEHLELPINDTVFHATYFFRGVPIFFVISGFLIWFSVARSKTYGHYLKKRFWRIYPELWLAVIVEILVLLILYHNWIAKDIILFAIGQGTMFQFLTPDSIRGYGVGTPNGALWTIGVMIQFYIVAWFVCKLMNKRKLVAWILGLLIAFGISWLTNYLLQNVISIEIAMKLFDQSLIRYFWLFYIGMFIAKYKDKILPFLQKYWGIFMIVAVIFFLTGWDLFSGYYLFWSMFMTLGLIGFSYKYPMLSIPIDLSYGVFLYHMTVVNVFVNFGWIGNWVYVIPIVLMVFVLSLTSTVTVGRLALLKKQRMIY